MAPDDADRDSAADPLDERIAAQFSGRGERADVWRVLALAVETERYLNLGYSPRYRTHLLGSPQLRLVDVVVDRLADHLPEPAGRHLLDLGCGRGGPAVRLADRLGVKVLGLDLVPYNLEQAREAAKRDDVAPHGVSPAGGEAAFVAGDATRPPVRDGAFAACTAVDSLVYVPDRRAALAAARDVLEPGGVLVMTDLVAAEGLDAGGRDAVDAFAATWDMPTLATRTDHERALDTAGFAVRSVADLTPHSVGRFRRYTTLALGVLATPAGRLIRRVLRARDVDPDAVVEQVRRAHRALPHLRHALVVATTPGSERPPEEG